MMRRRLGLVLWVLSGVLVALLLLKSFVADVYSVDSGSMRPTLFGGRDRADGEVDTEHVLVLYGQDFEPKRFDIVVCRSPDGSKPLVKRVVGLPGDRDLMIRGGDLFIDRKRLPPDQPRPAPVLVYDDRYLPPEQFFGYRRDGTVRREGEAWVVEGAPTPPGNLVHYHPALRDDYFDRHHRRVPGVVEVNDAVLELAFRLEAPLESQTLRLWLVEEGDTFEVALSPSEGGGAHVRLVRRNQSTTPPAKELLLAVASVELEAERWYSIRFSNIDNHLRVVAPELKLDLSSDYAENEPWPAPLPMGQHSLGPRVRFGIQGGRAAFRAVRILRDLYYTDDGVYGVVPDGGTAQGARETLPVALGPDDYFLLGDNSPASTDSRLFGAIKAARLIGRPVAVVWPDPHWIEPVGP